MKKRRSVLALLLVAALTVVLGGCQDGKDGKADSSDTTSSQVSTESTPTGEPVMGGSITVGIPQDIEDSLDPHKSVAAGTKEILFNIYEGLVKPDEEGNLNDAVAESHSISEDGKVYTFKLRNGVKFHDGTTVTAEDVKYSIERCAGINGDGTPLVEAFSNVDKVEIPDESTIDIYLKEADTEFLAYLTVAIVPEHVEDLEADLYEEEDEDGESEDAEDEDTDGDDDAKDDDIASEPFYEVACPNCGETVYVSEDDLDAREANCAHCGVTFEVALEGDDEEAAEDGPVQYEVTCPDCGTTSVFEEDELLDGAPKCPNCGKALDFEVTEE